MSTNALNPVHPVAPKKNGENGLRPEDRSVHAWFRFVLSYPPHLVRHYLELFGIEPGLTVLDPFCGTGTTLVECKKLGISSIGIESNPFPHFASQTKTNWRANPDEMLAHSRFVAGVALDRLKTDGIEDIGIDGQSKSLDIRLRTLPPESQKLLLKDSISPLPLHKTLTLLETLEEHSDIHFMDYQRLALAKALVSGVGNLHFGPEVGVGKPKSDAPVISLWMNNISSMSDDLRYLQSKRKSYLKSSVLLADAREIAEIVVPGSIDAVITSPPYPNEKDYTRTTRLESVILGFIRDKAELRTLKRGLVCSNTRGAYKDDIDDSYISDNKEIDRIAKAIENRRIELGKTSGFERLYARVTKLYFGGMARHLADMRSALKPGAQLAYVVGDQASYLRVMIRTGTILADIAASLGYEVAGIDLFRTRLATATKAKLREEVVLLKWPGNGKSRKR